MFILEVLAFATLEPFFSLFGGSKIIFVKSIKKSIRVKTRRRKQQKQKSRKLRKQKSRKHKSRKQKSRKHKFL
jgi:hypothetical protein